MSIIKLAGATALATLLSSAASAHIVADPAVAQPGSYFRTALRVGHGCGAGKPTTAIRVSIPAGIANASAQPKPGWEIKVETTKLAQPIDAGHGRKTDTVVSAVVWSGGSLANEQFDEFGLVLKLPETPGLQLWLPVVQTCAGGETRWDQTPAAGEKAERPAALIRIADGSNTSSHQHGAARAAKAGEITIDQPFARATPAKVGGVFMMLKNAGGNADRLVKAASPVAETVELHTHVKDGDAMRMRPVENIPVPAKGQTALEPGGYHVMLIGLKQALKEGTSFPLTLTFEKAGTVTLDIPVQKAGSSGAPAAGGHEHKH
jgi:copper(I)-binding protein